MLRKKYVFVTLLGRRAARCHFGGAGEQTGYGRLFKCRRSAPGTRFRRP